MKDYYLFEKTINSCEDVLNNIKENNYWYFKGNVKGADELYKIIESSRYYYAVKKWDEPIKRHYLVKQKYFIITDENLKILDYDIITQNQKRKKDKKYQKYGYSYKGVKYRKDPIPGIHTNKSIGGIFRAFPKVKDDLSIEQKELKKDYPTTKITIQRAKRNYKNMPNSYDDIYKSELGNKNWKKIRRKQYKHIRPNRKAWTQSLDTKDNMFANINIPLSGCKNEQEVMRILKYEQIPAIS